MTPRHRPYDSDDHAPRNWGRPTTVPTPPIDSRWAAALRAAHLRPIVTATDGEAVVVHRDPADDRLYVDDDRHVGVRSLAGWSPYVGWCDVAWLSPSEPVLRLRDIELVDDLGPSEADGSSPVLAAALRLAAERREAHLRACRYCEKRIVPGHRSGDACHGCLTLREGVLF